MNLDLSKYIFHRVTMSVLLLFVGICTANSFNKICVHMLCRKNKEEYFKRVISRKSVWQYYITIIFLFCFVLYCWSCISSTKYLFLEWSITDEKDESNWMASKIKCYVKPEPTQYFLLSFKTEILSCCHLMTSIMFLLHLKISLKAQTLLLQKSQIFS